LFVDIRDSTSLAETRLPYDVVFLLNSLFAALAEAVEKSGGYYSNFTGDGLMALFGLDGKRAKGARAALRCALAIFQTLDSLNERLVGELEVPLAVGIGIHTGQVIVGRMGAAKDADSLGSGRFSEHCFPTGKAEQGSRHATSYLGGNVASGWT